MKRNLAILAILVAIAYVFCYPMGMWLRAPYPDHADAVVTNELKWLYVAMELYRGDMGKSPQTLEQLEKYDYHPTQHPRYGIIRIQMVQADASHTNRRMIAYATEPLPAVKSWKQMMAWERVRGWPDKPVPERRGVLYSDGSVELVKEMEFKPSSGS